MGLKNLALWVDGIYRKDAIFDSTSPLNRDNCLSTVRLLKARLAEAGWECRTHDIYKSQGVLPDAVLFNDIPKTPLTLLLGGWKGKTKCFVVLNECEVIKPENWNLKAHAQFDAIFTWAERFVDNKKYFKTNFSNTFTESMPDAQRPREKFCVMIAAHKKRPHPLELYTEREKTVRWFEDNHPGDFDLYGVGWDRYAFNGPALMRLLNRVKPLTKLLAPYFLSYKGLIARKRPVLEKYKFSICYENARGIPGYITEKIFDSFFAGCVPVYWGAPDIAKYVPLACFIDRREFKTHEELYAFMKAMTPADYAAKIGAIAGYLAGGKAYQFSDNYFVQTVAKVIADAKGS